MRLIDSNKLKNTFAPYSKGCLVGDLIFYSGQVALDDEGSLVKGGIACEAKKLFENIDILLMEANLSVTDVVKLNVYIAEMNQENFSQFNEVYSSWVGNHKPARTAIGVYSLPKNANVEIEFIAYNRASVSL